MFLSVKKVANYAERQKQLHIVIYKLLRRPLEFVWVISLYMEKMFTLLYYCPFCVLHFNQHAAFFNFVHNSYVLKQIN
jgi:hypothetical protein